MPKKSPPSTSKRRVTKLADGKAKEMLEPLLPHTICQSASMSSNAHAADVILAPSDIKGSEPDSVFNSYPPKIPLDTESNELGLFNGADMACDIPSSSLHQDGYAKVRTSDNLSALTHMRPYQSATKYESSPYPDFEYVSGVRGVRTRATSTGIEMQSYDSEPFGFSNPPVGNAQARNDLRNGVEGALSHPGYASHGLPTKQTSCFNPQKDHAYGSSTTSHPQEPSMGNIYPNCLVIDVQTTPQPLDPAGVYGHSHRRKTDLFHSALDPRAFLLDDPLTLVGDEQSQVSEPSRSSMLNMPAKQMSHYPGASPKQLVCQPLHSCNHRLKPSRLGPRRNHSRLFHTGSGDMNAV